MNRTSLCRAIALLSCLAVSSPQATAQATLAIPAGLTGFPSDTLIAPVFISTTAPIRAAQLLVDFANKDFKFIDAVIGTDANGFAASALAPQPPVTIATAGATENVLIQLASSDTRLLFGSDLNVLFLRFKVVGAAGGASPFAFNPDSIATFLTTDNGRVLKGADLQFNNGSGAILNLATLSIPGGFSVAKAETLFAPVRLSSVKAVGVAQMALEYDGSDLAFLGAQVGPEAVGFSIFVEPAPGFLPTTPGTNKNVLISLYSGGSGIAGDNKTVALLLFLATGEIGGNSPIAFDRRAQHTVLSTIDLVDLTGADLAFHDGDATILPPLVKLRGNVFYGNSTAPVAGALVTLSGLSNFASTTNAGGAYLIRKITPGSYTLRPSKTGDERGAIQGSDALLILRATAFIDSLPGEESFRADVTRDGRITVSDALAVLRFLAAQTTGIGQTGAWIFQPDFAALFIQSDTTQNFKTFLLGDVNGSWSAAPSLNQQMRLPFASVKFGEWREDGENIYLALRAGNEGKVFTALASLALPANLGNALRFVPASTDILAVTNYDAKQDWHLALAATHGVAPEEKIGELALPRAAASGLQSWQFQKAEVNDWPQKLTNVETRDGVDAIPAEYTLSQNYPNPFNPATWIVFGIPARAGETEVRLEIFTVEGKLVRSLVAGKLTSGTHRVQWDGHDANGETAPTGIYFYRLRADKFTASRRLLLVK
jgi:hypothetical protein